MVANLDNDGFFDAVKAERRITRSKKMSLTILELAQKADDFIQAKRLAERHGSSENIQEARRQEVILTTAVQTVREEADARLADYASQTGGPTEADYAAVKEETKEWDVTLKDGLPDESPTDFDDHIDEDP